MNELQYKNELSRCVRCGACKSLCPTYFAALNERMSARGRVAMLGGLSEEGLSPNRGLADGIFSCMLCEACRDLCPVGINIPEIIYKGRNRLKKRFRRAYMLTSAVKFSLPRMDAVFTLLRGFQKLFLNPLYSIGRLRYMPQITSTPFKNSFRLYKNKKRAGRVAIFAGCSVNYLHPHIGESLLNVLISRGFEVVVFRGEVCCGSPMRSLGLEDEAKKLAGKNIELFTKIRAEAILSLCPTCTMVIKNQYPALTGESIPNIMDTNEFFLKYGIAEGLEIAPAVYTYHDPCHLTYGLGITEEPRRILRGIGGAELVEMEGAKECCGFGGLFSACFKDMSIEIGTKKINSIINTDADTVVTSCPGCMMQLEDLKRRTGTRINIMHMAEVVDEAMHE